MRLGCHDEYPENGRMFYIDDSEHSQFSTMQHFVIRPANRSDFDTVYSFVCELENEVFDRAEMKRCFEICLNRENSYYLVAFA